MSWSYFMSIDGQETESAGKIESFGRNLISAEIPPLERTIRSSKSFALKMLRPSKIFCEWIKLASTSVVKPHLQKQDTNMRKSIPAGEKLALNLRYLATGEFISSALFHIHVGMAKRASLGDRILPKTSCYPQYSELFYILAAYDKCYTYLVRLQ